MCPYDWSKRSEYRAAAESQEALAPSYADIQKRIAEAKAALGLSSAGEPSDMMEALAGACRGDGGPAKPKRDKKQNQFKDMPPELRPVGNAPFDKPKPLTKE